MNNKTLRKLVLVTTVWGGLALLAAGSPTQAQPMQPCGNTNCVGAHLCAYMIGSQCSLTGSSCTVTDC